MSKMVTLKTNLLHRYGKGVILGGVEVQFDQFGMTDVVERHAEALIQAGLEPVDAEDVVKYNELKKQVKEESIPSIDAFDENVKLKARIAALEQENEDLKEYIEKQKEVVTGNENDGKIDISAMKVGELKEACKDAGLPEAEWKNLKEKELREYLKKKLEE